MDRQRNNAETKTSLGPYRTASVPLCRPTGFKLWWKRLRCKHSWYVLEYVGQEAFTPALRFLCRCINCTKEKKVSMMPSQRPVEEFLTRDMTEAEKQERQEQLEEARKKDANRKKTNSGDLIDQVNRGMMGMF